MQSRAPKAELLVAKVAPNLKDNNLCHVHSGKEGAVPLFGLLKAKALDAS